MIRHVGRVQMIGIAAILAVLFITEFAMPGSSHGQRTQPAQATLQR
jgi:hypothetical protein